MMKFRIILILFLFLGEIIFATEYYCDPVNGSMNNDGSKDSPWSKLEEVFSSGKTFQSGDVIFLLSGYHGNVSVEGKNADYVSIKNYLDQTPRLSRLVFGTSTKTTKWVIDGLIIGAEFNGTFHKKFSDAVYGPASIETTGN